MPKLWDVTIDAHRREVREAILEATAELIAERGLLAVTMSLIAAKTGIGRATLYKYFPDVEAILVAWHERQMAAHLVHLGEVRDEVDDARARVEAVLSAYARITYESQRRHDPELAAFLHRGPQVTRARHELHGMVRDLLREAAEAAAVRDDVTPAELANYCLYALAAAGNVPSKAAVRRLVAVTLAGLRPQRV